MLIVGTSGEVYPAAGLVQIAVFNRAKIVLVNLDPSPFDDMVDAALHGRAAEIVPQLV
jgi:NAD-dependent deacetylase